VPGTILVIGPLEARREQVAYVCDLIHARGHDVITIEAGQHARAAALLRAQRIDGVLGIGDASTALLATQAMRQLPIGVPKLMVSTAATGDTRPYVDVSDVAMVNPVVDAPGLNAVSRRVLANAVGAICGMVEQKPPPAEDRPLLAATMFGVTTPCVTAVRRRLEHAGYEVLVFHATGSGGRAMEGLIDAGWFAGVIDITTTEWADEVVGGMRSAGPDRLSAAGRHGIPQVVSVGALDMVNFGTIETVPVALRTRRLHRHTPHVTLLRTTPLECAEIGRRIAEQLNRARGPTVLVLPLQGVSQIDAEGQPFHDPEADRALFDALRGSVAPPVTIVEVDAHINDAAFADAVATTFLALMSER
jgi:uncharacterized protein (UPF0261 family)